MSGRTDSARSTYYILTGSGPATFRHNQRMDGISDLAGNIQQYIDGIKVNAYQLYAYNSTNTGYELIGDVRSLNMSDNHGIITGEIRRINNSNNDILNEGIVIRSGGLYLTTPYAGYSGYISTNYDWDRYFVRGASADTGTNGGGIWGFEGTTSYDEYNTAGGDTTFRICRDLI